MPILPTSCKVVIFTTKWKKSWKFGSDLIYSLFTRHQLINAMNSSCWRQNVFIVFEGFQDQNGGKLHLDGYAISLTCSLIITHIHESWPSVKGYIFLSSLCAVYRPASAIVQTCLLKMRSIFSSYKNHMQKSIAFKEDGSNKRLTESFPMSVEKG